MRHHTRPDGTVGPCSAKPGNCPYEEFLHAETREEALEISNKLGEIASGEAVNKNLDDFDLEEIQEWINLIDLEEERLEDEKRLRHITQKERDDKLDKEIAEDKEKILKYVKGRGYLETLVNKADYFKHFGTNESVDNSEAHMISIDASNITALIANGKKEFDDSVDRRFSAMRSQVRKALPENGMGEAEKNFIEGVLMKELNKKSKVSTRELSRSFYYQRHSHEVEPTVEKINEAVRNLKEFNEPHEIKKKYEDLVNQYNEEYPRYKERNQEILERLHKNIYDRYNKPRYIGTNAFSGEGDPDFQRMRTLAEEREKYLKGEDNRYGEMRSTTQEITNYNFGDPSRSWFGEATTPPPENKLSNLTVDENGKINNLYYKGKRVVEMRDSFDENFILEDGSTMYGLDRNELYRFKRGKKQDSQTILTVKEPWGDKPYEGFDRVHVHFYDSGD